MKFKNDMKYLMIGDVTDYLAKQAREYSSDAQLVTQDTMDIFLGSKKGTFYTSLGDFTDTKLFVEILSHSDEIMYCPPSDGIWSDSGTAPDDRFNMETEIKEHLYQWSYIHRKPVIGLETPDFLDPIFDNTLVITPRITDRKQIWNFGCSITVGIGVDKDQTYGHLLNQKLGLPISVVAYGGSSIRWAADQIMCSDIKKDDLVIWGLTSFNRFGYFLHDNRYYHIIANFFNDYPQMRTRFESDILISPDVAYQGLRSIMGVDNFCRQVGATLVILGVFPTYVHEKLLKQYPNFVATDCKFKDLGHDNQHPGPKHHEFYCKKVIEYLHKNKYIEELT